MKILHSSITKILVGALAVLLLITAVAAAIGTVAIYAGDIQRVSFFYLRSEVFRTMLSREQNNIWNAYIRGDDPAELYKHSNVLFTITDKDGKTVAASHLPLSGEAADKELEYSSIRSEWLDYADTLVTVQVNPNLPYRDAFKITQVILVLVYNLRYAMPYIAVGCAVLYLILLILLMCGAGHRRRSEDIARSWFDRIPLDLLLLLYFVLFALHVSVPDMLWGAPYRVWNALIGLAAFTDAILITVLLTSLAVRVKSGTVLKNTLIWRVIILAWRIVTFIWCRIVLPVLRFIGRGIARFFRFIGLIFGSIPLIPKTALLIGANGVLDILAFFFIYGVFGPDDAPLYLFFILLKDACLALLLLAATVLMRRIQAGGERMAAGHLDTPIDTQYMYGDFRRFAETMNQLGEGMSRAVDERMKSERFRTELITNVSHDIKTPLTSIVNYVDLMKKENVTEEPLSEYIRVLDRQSARLKKLTEDLIEASKAATGNVTVELSPCDAAMLIGQIDGEYGERLAARNLTMIITKPDHPVTILADGRLMWRVFDNLMSNILKYAMPGSRVYLSLSTASDTMCFTFRNISKDPLNIPGEELLERFTRGDSSRSTEGSGLGLSIANSLTELQGGHLALHVDGDLFKVTLTFPLR